MSSTAIAPNFDLHCHSNVSDGLLAPSDLVARAAVNGVTTLALTDHDTVAGLADAKLAADQCGIALVPGVEVSVSWHEETVHIVGLNIDPDCHALLGGIAQVRGGRRSRAVEIAAQLDSVGIGGSLEGAYRHAEHPDLIGRPHFARFLAESGYAKDFRTVFQRYLTPGKPGFVPHRWADLADAIEWIGAAGGVAVLAHPGRYKFGSAQRGELLGAFCDAGGRGIEVVTGNHTPEQMLEFSGVARRYGLAASRGSDFHAPGESWVELGRIPQLPDDLTPIWTLW